MSKYTSLLVYFKPAFRQGMGDEKAPPAALRPEPELIVELKFAPATLSSLLRREGGNTISLSAFGAVVRGWPPESKVSSKSWRNNGLCDVQEDGSFVT